MSPVNEGALIRFASARPQGQARAPCGEADTIVLIVTFVALGGNLKLPAGVTIRAIDLLVVLVQYLTGNDVIEVVRFPIAVAIVAVRALLDERYALVAIATAITLVIPA